MKYFLYALSLAFIVLKLTNFIDWSWWLVLSPIYVPATVLIPLYIIALIVEDKQKTKRDQLKKSRPSMFQQRLDDYMNSQNKS